MRSAAGVAHRIRSQEVSVSSRQALQALHQAAPAVLPSFLMCDFGNLEREIRALEAAGVRALHLDVMDGHFVPNLTYGMPIVEACRKLTDLPLDVHLMISDPASYASAMAQAGADVLTFHVEAVAEPSTVVQTIHEQQLAAGIALNPDTPLERMLPVVADCDLALVMSVTAGFGGQSFNPVALERLRLLRSRYPELLLEVDGGVNRETIAACRDAGADLMVVGSAIFGGDDYAAALSGLSAAMHASDTAGNN
jgi:ribulose-phosphate 3-epimerase